MPLLGWWGLFQPSPKGEREGQAQIYGVRDADSVLPGEGKRFKAITLLCTATPLPSVERCLHAHTAAPDAPAPQKMFLRELYVCIKGPENASSSTLRVSYFMTAWLYSYEYSSITHARRPKKCVYTHSMLYNIFLIPPFRVFQASPLVLRFHLRLPIMLILPPNHQCHHHQDHHLLLRQEEITRCWAGPTNTKKGNLVRTKNIYLLAHRHSEEEASAKKREKEEAIGGTRCSSNKQTLESTATSEEEEEEVAIG